MVILFLVALLLAWPTMGISLVAYLIFGIFRLYVKSRVNFHRANERLASASMSTGKQVIPSWIGQRDKNEIFVEGIQRGAMRHAVPRAFLQAVLQERESFRDLVHYAGAMEDVGASFVEQQVAVADKLVEMWRAAPDAVRRKLTPVPPKPSQNSPEYFDWANRKGRWEERED